MHVRLLFPNKYLGAPDLRGQDVTLTIHALTNEELRTTDGTDERKWVLHFAEMQKRPEDERKRLVLNKTNAQQIAKLHGAETDNWPGKRVTLYATTCKAFGEIVDCIRIRPRVPKGKGNPLPEPDTDGEPQDPTDADAP